MAFVYAFLTALGWILSIFTIVVGVAFIADALNSPVSNKVRRDFAVGILILAAGIAGVMVLTS